MIPKSFKKIELTDFIELKENAVAERKTIEYKSEFAISKDEDKKEFLFDVSSFANTEGGDLIFGITENQGIPVELKGIKIENLDSFKLQIENLIRDTIAPRINGIESQGYLLENGNYIYLIRIPKSWYSPHQVIYKGTDKFYSRASNGKHKMDINELRNAFLLSESVTEKVRTFRKNRLYQEILDGKMPIPLGPHGKIIIQFVPLSSLRSGDNFDFDYLKNNLMKLNPLGGHYEYYKYNLDGLVSYTRPHEGLSGSYIQFYRNGIIETVNSSLLAYSQPDEPTIPNYPGKSFEEAIIKTFNECGEHLKNMGVGTPIFVFLTFADVKGYTMLIRSRMIREGDELIDRRVLLLPEIVLEDHNFDGTSQLRPLFDMIWNACGYERSKNYDSEGKWIGVKS